MVKFLTVEPAGRPPGRPCQSREQIALWPVDRSVDRALRTVDRPVDRPHPRVGHLQSVDRPKWQVRVHILVHVGQVLDPVNRAVDRLQVPHSRVGTVDWTVDRKQGTVDRAVDRPESICSLDWDGRPGGRPLASNGQFFDRWRSTGPVDR